MTAPLSVRMPAELQDRLENAAAAAGESKTDLLRRLVDEGLRMQRFPGILFRSGPGGRRAALVGGPDVWEVIRVIRNTPVRGEPAIAGAAEWLDLPTTPVRNAVAYYAAHREEVDAWIERIDAEAEVAEAAWRRRRDVLA